MCRQLGMRSTKVEFSRFHMSTKSGPLGQAILTSVSELTLLPQELVDNIQPLAGGSLGEEDLGFDGWPFRRSELSKYMGHFIPT